jgi:peptidoglycan/LPS O-acetylase OafA/YrhL
MNTGILESSLRVEPAQAVSASRDLPSYLPWLDVLRFLACFLVIILHALPSAPPALGHAGVALFFSISGFLIGRVLLENRELSRFYARRFLRIYPAYLSAIALLAILSLTPFLRDPGLGRLFWHNIQYYLTFTFQLSPENGRLPLIIVWSLCVEELFYLLLPLLFLLGKNLRIAIALMVIVGLLLVPHFYLLPNGAGTWFLFPLNLFFGVFLALAQPRLRSYFPGVALGAVVLVVANAFTGWFHSFGPTSAVLCTATVWSLAVYDRKLPALFEPFRWMGKLSYGMYLLHLFCLSLALRGLTRFRGHPAIFYLSVIVLTTALTVFAAWLMQICIEDPALRLRPSLKRHPRLQYLLATVQVSLIPTGILLVIIQRAVR